MATVLNRNVKRITVNPHHGRQLVVTLLPCDLISMRQKGRRTSYVIPLSAVYDLGAKIYARAELKRKAEERKARRMK